VGRSKREAGEVEGWVRGRCSEREAFRKNVTTVLSRSRGPYSTRGIEMGAVPASAWSARFLLLHCLVERS
jgi:hypothetical protein